MKPPVDAPTSMQMRPLIDVPNSSSACASFSPPRLTYGERVLSTLKAGLRVVPQKDSNVFVAQMLVPVREGSSVVLNTLLDDYLAFRLQLWKGAGTMAFFQSQVADSGRELQTATRSIRSQVEKIGPFCLVSTSPGGLSPDGIGAGSGSLGIGFHTELEEKS